MNGPTPIRGNSGVGNAQSGGTQGFRFGDLKHRLPSIPLVALNSAPGETVPLMEDNTTFRLVVKGLSGVLNVHVSVGIEGETGFVRPEDVPAGAATMQITPINLFPDVAKKVYLRPVFQDPTLTPLDNQDHPLAVDIPFGWEGATEADQLELEVNMVITAEDESEPWVGALLNGRIVAQVAIEYNGQWWDQKAIQQAISQVTFEGGPDTLLTISTQGGG